MKNKKNYCEFEQTIIDSKREGYISPEQEAHIKGCTICSDSVTVFSWMNKFENLDQKSIGEERILPSPEEIWEKAFSPALNKKELIKKAMRPLAIAQLITYITIIIGVIFVLFRKSPFLQNLFGSISEKSSFFNSFSSLFESFSKTLPFLIVPLGMVSLLLISYFIYSLFNPENA